MVTSLINYQIHPSCLVDIKWSCRDLEGQTSSGWIHRIQAGWAPDSSSPGSSQPHTLFHSCQNRPTPPTLHVNIRLWQGSPGFHKREKQANKYSDNLLGNLAVLHPFSTSNRTSKSSQGAGRGGAAEGVEERKNTSEIHTWFFPSGIFHELIEALAYYTGQAFLQ